MAIDGAEEPVLCRGVETDSREFLRVFGGARSRSPLGRLRGNYGSGWFIYLLAEASGHLGAISCDYVVDGAFHPIRGHGEAVVVSEGSLHGRVRSQSWLRGHPRGGSYLPKET